VQSTADITIGRHTILVGDVRERLRDIPDDSVHCVVTSPPYFGLRDYSTGRWEGGLPECDHKVRKDPRIESSTLGGGKGTTGHQQEGYRDQCGRCGAVRVDRQIGLEPTLADYLATMVDVFREVRRVLRPDGTCWLNIGDSYAGGGGYYPDAPSNQPDAAKARNAPGAQINGARIAGQRSLHGLKPKDLMMVPARLAIALQDDGWWLRSDIIWHKRAPMPESVTDRPTSAHEHIFLLTKAPKYFYDAAAVAEPSEEPDRIRLDRIGGASGHTVRHSPGGMMRGVQTRNLRNVWTLSPEPFSGWTETSRQVPVAFDEADDDTWRTPSTDCPVHEWTGRPDPIRVRDERGGGASIRTSGNGIRRDSEPRSDSAPTGLIRAEATPDESLDSLPLLRALAATPHSNGTSKTGHAPATSSPCTPSGETQRRTDDMPASPACAALHHDMPASSISMDDLGAHREPHTSAGTVRTSSEPHVSAPCTCSYHKIVTESISHFATYPTEIPRRAIKAGTSERGVCAACGAPWVRQVERRPMVIARSDRREQMGEFGRTQSSGTMVSPPSTQTTGWAPSCACDADVIPATVIDPFLGSGTTMLVADQLGRTCIGVELNPAYAAMAEKRVRSDAPLFAGVA